NQCQEKHQRPECSELAIDDGTPIHATQRSSRPKLPPAGAPAASRRKPVTQAKANRSAPPPPGTKDGRYRRPRFGIPADSCDRRAGSSTKPADGQRSVPRLPALPAWPGRSNKAAGSEKDDQCKTASD